MKKLITIACLFALTAFIGFAQAADKEEAPALFNDKCPVSGKDVNESKTSAYKVEFCCNNCKGKFDKNPAKFIAKAAKGEEGKCIFSGKEAKASSTLTVGFCCGGCKGKFDKDPGKFIAKVKPVAKES